MCLVQGKAVTVNKAMVELRVSEWEVDSQSFPREAAVMTEAITVLQCYWANVRAVHKDQWTHIPAEDKDVFLQQYTEGRL